MNKKAEIDAPPKKRKYTKAKKIEQSASDVKPGNDTTVNIKANHRGSSEVDTNIFTQPGIADPDIESLTIAVTSNSGINEFDISELCIPINYGQKVGAVKVLSKVPVQKPGKANFIRCKIGEELRIYLYEDKKTNINYLFLKHIAALVPEAARRVQLRRVIDRQGNQFLTPIPLPDEDGKRNSWHESMGQCLGRAETTWIRIVANQGLGAYDIYEAQGELGEPDWTDHTIEDLLKIAFRGRIISEEDDPVIQELQGRI